MKFFASKSLGRKCILKSPARYDISIIMPSFNQGNYIEEALLSIISQKNVRCQVIVMDGGSTDSTRRVLETYTEYIYFNMAPDRGQGHALNKALERAEAPIVGWLNSDDMYLPGAFETVLETFNCHPNVSLVHGQRVMINERSEVIGWSRPGPFKIDSDRYNICSESAFWRRDCVAGHKFREDLKFAVDTHFLGLIASKRKHLYIQKYIGCFRCHPTSKSSTLWDEHAVPEATMIWNQLFGRNISFKQPVELSMLSSTCDKTLGFISLPSPLMASYLKHRIKRYLHPKPLSRH